MRSLAWRIRRSWIKRTGTLRQRERMGIVKRPQYAYGVLRAADFAAYFGYRAITVIELGVAEGAGLANLADMARAVEAETGVKIAVAGFDTGAGLPRPTAGVRDHPEIWSGGDFAMKNPEDLKRRLGGAAELVLGDVKDTVPGFLARLAETSPIGFVAVDLDLYSATMDALQLLAGPAGLCLPIVPMYLDDVASVFSNRWCGELAAVEEFNATHPQRKIDIDRALPDGRDDGPAPWHRRMYACHVLDHPGRAKPADRPGLSLAVHYSRLTDHHLG